MGYLNLLLWVSVTESDLNRPTGVHRKTELDPEVLLCRERPELVGFSLDVVG